MMGQYDGVECTLAMCVIHDAFKHVSVHLYAVKKWDSSQNTTADIRVSWFIVGYTIKDALLCHVATRAAEDVVT